MGRRKIAIRPISDDRNRSVTFLKRKGGLFKKAHELSVLCSVDVAVIIFGHNKKLYEFSSGDIQETIGRYQYYGGPHEHKGPDDFKDKKDGDDDDDEDDIEEPPRDSGSPPQPLMAHHLQNQPAFQHMGTPSQSPPMPNGAFHHPQHRHPSPQPPQNISRPGSRAHVRHPSHLGPPQPQQHLQVSQGPPPPHAQPSYAYMPNPPIYNPQQAAGMQIRPQSGPPHPPQFYPQPPTTHPQQHPPQHAQVQQVQQQFQQDQRRQPPPPGYQQQQQHQQQHQQQQQHPQEQRPQPPPQPSPQPHPAHFHSPPMPQPKPLPASKQHSIFTPIDDSRSLLAAHWTSSSNAEQPTSEPLVKVETGPRSQSIDIASINRKQPNGMNGSGPPSQQPEQSHPINQGPAPPMRTASTPVIPSIHQPVPPSRTNSMQADPRRPRLKVQIPDDEEEGQRTGMESSPSQANAAAQRTPIREHPGVVLPPPSPSAGSLLSAGATGPPNPFARPPIPPANASYGSRNDLETPISALPSRFVSDNLLPSPSSFYAEWSDFGRSGNNMLPSPLTFQTPVVANGPSFKEEESEKKRKPEGPDDAPGKRLKT